MAISLPTLTMGTTNSSLVHPESMNEGQTVNVNRTLPHELCCNGPEVSQPNQAPSASFQLRSKQKVKYASQPITRTVYFYLTCL